jgi:hypothetical protein
LVPRDALIRQRTAHVGKMDSTSILIMNMKFLRESLLKYVPSGKVVKDGKLTGEIV